MSSWIYHFLEEKKAEEKKKLEKERRMQEAMLSIRERFGSNAVVRGLNLQEGATGLERSKQIGGHKA